MAVHHILFFCVLLFLCFQGHGNRPCTPSNSHRDLSQDAESPPIALPPEYFKVPVKELGVGSFGVVVGFGTPRQDLNMFLDTGSSLTWIWKCQSCSQSDCNNSSISIFDTSKSSTFSKIPCTNSSSSKCNYFIQYNDGSSSNGSFVRDTLTFSNFSYTDFVFGCSVSSGGDYRDFDGADGLIGIGPGVDSFLYRAVNFHGLFCHCLPSSKSSTGFIIFDALAIAVCKPDPENSIPLLILRGSDRYLVNLVGITIGQTRLDMKAYMDSSPLRVIVDSGTTITRLPGSFHEALKSEFKKLMSGYSEAPPLSELLDLCYDLTGHNNVSVPNMVLHFEGSKDVQLDSSGVLWRENESLVCLAFAGNKEDKALNIIGGHQQRSLNVHYDIPGRKIAFGKGSC